MIDITYTPEFFKEDGDFPLISAEIICDSKNTVNNSRLTTFKITVPRIILAELNTHKSLSKNCESSRAVPTKKLRSKVMKTPMMPVFWGKNKSGMSASESLKGFRLTACKAIWRLASYEQVFNHWILEKLGLHKQTANRLIEPWLTVTDVITGTDKFWDNFFRLRLSPMAQPEMQVLAFKMYLAYKNSTPKTLGIEEAHLPFVTDEEKEKFGLADQIKISVARCCRTSYNNMMGSVSKPEEDIKLFYRAVSNGHFSPTEHQGFVPSSNTITKDEHYDLMRGFRGWYQLRAFIEPSDNMRLLKKHYGIDLNLENNK